MPRYGQFCFHYKHHTNKTAEKIRGRLLGTTTDCREPYCDCRELHQIEREACVVRNTIRCSSFHVSHFTGHGDRIDTDRPWDGTEMFWYGWKSRTRNCFHCSWGKMRGEHWNETVRIVIQWSTRSRGKPRIFEITSHIQGITFHRDYSGPFCAHL